MHYPYSTMKAFITYFLLAAAALTNQLHAFQDEIHSVVYLISTPRSLTTAFTRMMFARGDFSIYHEPSHNAYCLIHHPEFAKQTYTAKAPATYETVKQTLLEEATKIPVFVKEMSNAAEEFLKANPDFLSHEHVRFAILLREPHHSMISYYKKAPELVKNLHEILGYEALYHLIQWMGSHAKHPFHILHSEDLCNNTEEAVQAYCKSMGIAYLPEALHWKALDSSFDPERDWHEYKIGDSIEHWHSDALSSTGFAKSSYYAVDSEGSPTFEEIANLEDREEIKRAYAQTLPYYLLLKNY